VENSVVKTHKIKIGGREFTLAFTLRAMLKMQQRIEGFDFNQIDKLVQTPDGMLQALYILAENGEKLEGRTIDVDEDWFALRIPANLRKFVTIQLAITETLTDGMSMEAEDDDERSREVDVVLQEIQKKRERTSLHGEKSPRGDSSQD